MDEPKTLYDLREGDAVLIQSQYYEQIATVIRLTKQYIIVGNTKYRKKDGCKVAQDRWEYERLSVISPEDLERIKKRKKHERLVLEVRAISFQSLSNEQLQSIIDIASKK